MNKLLKNSLQFMGVTPNSGGKSELPPLIIASREGYIEIIKLLIGAKAEINAKDGIGNTALIEAAQNGHIEIVKFLLDRKADFTVKNVNGTTALASSSGHNDIKELLKKAGAKE